MISSAFKALSDLLSPEFRSILWKSVGLTLLLFIGLFTGVQTLFWFLTFVSWPWTETALAVGSGLALLVLFFFLMAPVTAIFAGLFLDRIAALVEARHYPNQQPGTALPTARALLVSLQFAGLVLLVNLFALPLIFTGFGAIVLITVNAYLLSREYFEFAAMRFMHPEAAKQLRKENASTVFSAGFLPAILSVIPILNLTVPLFSTSYFVHLFKKLQSPSV